MSNIIYFGTDVEVANCGVIIILPRLYQSSGSFFCRSNKLLSCIVPLIFQGFILYDTIYFLIQIEKTRHCKSRRRLLSNIRRINLSNVNICCFENLVGRKPP